MNFDYVNSGTRVKIGVVKHLNARPLSYGFEKQGDHEIIYENPSILKELLLESKLDTALISSVECIRNESVLSFSRSTGVCAGKKVRSILFFRNIKEEYPPSIVPVDFGSRSSVALLKVLLNMQTGTVVETRPEKPEWILNEIQNGRGSHLLFGDNALLAKWDEKIYHAIDLATWWNTLTDLSFCFAFWAFPKDKPVPDYFFEDSLEYGKNHLEEIISREKRFSKEMLDFYLKRELHYFVMPGDWDGFLLFKEKCLELGLA